MMDIKKLKQSILDKNINLQFFIFVCPTADCSFVAKQYIREIAKIHKSTLCKLDDITQITERTDDIFDTADTNDIIRMFEIDKLENVDIDVESNKDTIIICKSISDDLSKKYRDNIIDFPKLENWQIEDYATILLDGLSKTAIDWIVKTCNHNIYRIENEANKLSLFEKDKREYLFECFVKDGLLDDLSNYTIFNFSNALITKNIKQLKIILSEIENIDIEPVGLITVLYNNFKNILNIQLNPRATADSLNMTSKQFNAIKYNIGYFNPKALTDIFKIVTDIDYRLKSGLLPADKIIDYLTLNVISR